MSEDENFVDSGSRVLGHFRGGGKKGEICYSVVFYRLKDALFSLDKHPV